MDTLVAPKEPSAFLHAVMYARLHEAELVDPSENTLFNGNLERDIPLPVKEVAREYKARFGAFHPSYFITREKERFEQHLFWVLRHHHPSRIALAYDITIESFAKGIPHVFLKATATQKTFVNFSRQASLELHRLKGFIRLRKRGEHVLYGYLETEYDVIDLLVSFFQRRAPAENIVLQNRQTLYFSKDALAIEAFDIDEDGDETYVKDLFTRYYESQYIPERKNMRLLKHFVPKRYWSWLDEGDALERAERE